MRRFFAGGSFAVFALTTLALYVAVLGVLLVAPARAGFVADFKAWCFGLDPATGRLVLDLLIELQARRGMTAVLVTHNPEVANRCASIWRLEDGLLQA